MKHVIHPYSPKHKSNVLKFLNFLENNYPNYKEWAIKKLNSSDTISYLVFHNEQVIGIGIGAIKKGDKFKISTFYIAPDFRKQSLGHNLLQLFIQKAVEKKATQIYITANSTLHSTLGEFLTTRGFVLTTQLPNKYVTGHTENVYIKTLSR